MRMPLSPRSRDIDPAARCGPWTGKKKGLQWSRAKPGDRAIKLLLHPENQHL